jgi:hypothetical protein
MRARDINENRFDDKERSEIGGISPRESKKYACAIYRGVRSEISWMRMMSENL